MQVLDEGVGQVVGEEVVQDEVVGVELPLEPIEDNKEFISHEDKSEVGVLEEVVCIEHPRDDNDEELYYSASVSASTLVVALV